MSMRLLLGLAAEPFGMDDILEDKKLLSYYEELVFFKRDTLVEPGRVMTFTPNNSAKIHRVAGFLGPPTPPKGKGLRRRPMTTQVAATSFCPPHHCTGRHHLSDRNTFLIYRYRTPSYIRVRTESGDVSEAGC
jgi:hypothetical protein